MKTKGDLVGLLERTGIAYESFESGSRWMIVAPALAARIMGAGVGEENAFWVSPEISTLGWGEGGNAGGQRSWLAPEAGPAGFFFSPDGSRWGVPLEMDPGSYFPVPEKGEWRGYRSAFTARAASGERYPIFLTRSMRILEGTDAGLRDSALSIRFRHELTNAGIAIIDRRIGLWSILQLPCGEPGTVLFGLRAEPADAAAPLRPYFSSLPEGIAGYSGNIAWMRAGGGRKYKVGLPAAYSAGTVAFLRRSRVRRADDKTFLLTALSFNVDAAAAYLDKPYHSDTEAVGNGDAAQAYNDPGTGDSAFCEIEAHAPAAHLGPGESCGADIDILVAHLAPHELDEFMARNLRMDSVPRSVLPD